MVTELDKKQRECESYTNVLIRKTLKGHGTLNNSKV